MKRPVAWRLDDRFGTRPLVDVIATGPQYGIRDWLLGIAEVIRRLGSPRGRAYSRWQRAYDMGSPAADRLYAECLG
jgi:hypothetical protein